MRVLLCFQKNYAFCFCGSLNYLFGGRVICPGRGGSWRQRRELRLIACEQDSLKRHLRLGDGLLVVIAIPSVVAITVTSKLALPALKRPKPHAQQRGQLTGMGSMRNPFVEDFQGPTSIASRRLSSPSIPQKTPIFLRRTASQ